jgi:hypothetical protein
LFITLFSFICFQDIIGIVYTVLDPSTIASSAGRKPHLTRTIQIIDETGTASITLWDDQVLLIKPVLNYYSYWRSFIYRLKISVAAATPLLPLKVSKLIISMVAEIFPQRQRHI